ncbi:MAG: virulence factor family protein [Candidatus Binatia bacterium]
MSRQALALALLALASACRPAVTVQQRAEGRFGQVAIYAPTTPPNGMVFVFSDTGGWTGDLDADGRALAAGGAAVVGIDLRSYLRGLAASDDGCHYLISEVEDLSKRVQRDLGAPSYHAPILSGVGVGGTLAYAALAQSPAATVAGAVSVDPAPALPTKVPLCPGAPSEPQPGAGFRYASAPSLPGWWRVSPGDAVAPPLRGLATPAAADGAPTTRLLTVVAGALAADAGSADAAHALVGLPLVELPAAHGGDVMAVIYSGDGGWRDIDKQIGEYLAARGMPVVGVDSLRYFWRAKAPEQVAHDLERVLAYYGARWHARHVVLIGYSFGAGILPFAYNRLPADARARVIQLSLLGLEHHAPFEFTVTAWLGAAPVDAPAVLPEVQRLPPGLLQCVYGAEEEDTVCRESHLPAGEIIRTRGGHHFDGDYKALAERILAGARVRAAGLG